MLDLVIYNLNQAMDSHNAAATYYLDRALKIAGLVDILSKGN